MVSDAPPRRRAWRIATRFAGMLLLATGAAACSSEPVASTPVQPTPPLAFAGSIRLPFREATYVLSLMGPDSLACRALQSSGLGHVVTTTIDMHVDGTMWRGRPQTPAGGVFDLSLMAGPLIGGPGGGLGVTGSLNGFVVNTLELTPGGLAASTADRRVSVGGPSVPQPASVTGGVSQDGVIASGQLSGDFVFSSSTGVSAVCRSATMSWMVSLAGQ